jgi:hypothetical protein
VRATEDPRPAFCEHVERMSHTGNVHEEYGEILFPARAALHAPLDLSAL